MFNKKKIAIAAVIAVFTAAAFGCGKDEGSSSKESKPAVEATEAVTEAPTEEETEPETEAPTEPETEPETEAPTEEETEPEAPAEISDVPTVAETIAMINDAFGIRTDGTVEGNIQAARDWDIIGENDVINTDAKVSAQFLICAAMRATGFVDGSSKLSQIVQSAVERGVIEVPNLALVDVSKADEIIEKAKYAWIHQEFRTEIHVELCDGVVDLTEEISVSDYSINGDTVELPARYASQITEGTVFILPKDPETGKGGAYKAGTVNSDGSTASINCSPAGISDVYKSITSE